MQREPAAMSATMTEGRPSAGSVMADFGRCLDEMLRLEHAFVPKLVTLDQRYSDVFKSAHDETFSHLFTVATDIGQSDPPNLSIALRRMSLLCLDVGAGLAMACRKVEGATVSPGRYAVVAYNAALQAPTKYGEVIERLLTDFSHHAAAVR